MKTTLGALTKLKDGSQLYYIGVAFSLISYEDKKSRLSEPIENFGVDFCVNEGSTI